MRFIFEPRDLWVGIYWTKDKGYLEVYLCLLPTLVLKFGGM